MTKEDIYTTVAKNIKKYRIQKRLTIKQLSKRCGYSYAFLRRIEGMQTRKNFSIQAIYVIAKSLEIDIKCLFEENDI